MTKRIGGSRYRTVFSGIQNFSIGHIILSAGLLGGWLLGSGSGFADAPRGTQDVPETVEQIRALRDQIAALLATLPPEVRQSLNAELRFDGPLATPEQPKPERVPAAKPLPPTPTEPAPAVTPVTPSTEPAPSPPLSDSGVSGDDPNSPPTPPTPGGIASPVPGPSGSAPSSSTAPSSNSAPSSSQSARDGQASDVRPESRRRSRRCAFLAALDTNEDGQIDALDRHWRHLFIWRDRNGDRAPQENEIRSAYEAGVRTLTTDADTFTRKKGSLGEIRQVDGEIWLDLRGDGFANRQDDGVLMVDATALARRGGPGLFSAAGQRLAGMEPVLRGMEIRPDGGTALRLDCP